MQFFRSLHWVFLFIALLGVVSATARSAVSADIDISTHSTTLTRTVDTTQANLDEKITVTVTFTNNETTAPLRGFYYADHLPEGLTITPVSVEVDSTPVLNFISESSASGMVYAGAKTWRWILETPPVYSQNNPLNAGSTLEIVYTIEASQAGVYQLNEFNWAGYFPDLPDKEAFGFSEIADRITVEFMAAKDNLAIITESCPNGVLSQSYDFTLQAMGGIEPYNWTVISGSLPPGLTLNPASGLISSTPSSTGTFPFTVQCADSDAPSSTVTEALSIKVLSNNSPPSFTGATLTPTLAYETTNLSVECSGWSDPDGDTESYHYQWWDDGSLIGGATSSTLTGVHFNKGSVISCIATAWDGAVEGNSIETASVTIRNSAPSFTGATLIPNPAYKTSILTVICSGWFDADGDPEDYIYQWYIRFAASPDWIPFPGPTESTMTGDNFDRGDTLACLVTAWDGELEGNSSATILVPIINSPPTFNVATITPNPAFEDSTLTVNCGGWSDADGDPEGYHYQWIKNGYEPIFGVTGSTLTNDYFAVGDSITCRTAAWDGIEEGATIEPSAVIIRAGPAPSTAAKKFWFLYSGNSPLP